MHSNQIVRQGKLQLIRGICDVFMRLLKFRFVTSAYNNFIACSYTTMLYRLLYIFAQHIPEDQHVQRFRWC